MEDKKAVSDTGRTDPLDARDAHYQDLKDFKESTRREVEERRNQIETLRERRRELRLAAANSAGLIGLQYQAESNSYTRLVPTLDDGLVMPEIVERPDPRLPLAPPDPPAEKGAGQPEEPKFAGERAGGVLHWLGELVLWLLVVPVGAFVGVGLATLAGFVWQRDPWAILPPAIVFGVAIVAGLKLMISHLWAHVGRCITLKNSHWTPMTLAFLLTVGGCALDAHLGAMALRQYSLNRSFRASDAMSYEQSFFLALAITTPLLLAAAIRAYRHGLREPSEEDRLQARAERERERWLQKQAKAEEAAAKRAELREQALAKHHAESEGKVLAEYEDRKGLSEAQYQERKRLESQREQDWGELKAHPEFKCLQGLIGQIGVLTHEIEDREKELTRFKISRGFEKAGEFGSKNGSAVRVEPEVAHLNGEAENAFVS